MKRLPLALALLLTVPATAGPTSLNAQLLKAAEQGKEAQVKALLQKGASVNARNGDQVTALMLASQRGQFRIVDMLLAKGANVKARDSGGSSVLSYTVDPELLKELVARGAKASAKDSGILADTLENLVWLDSDADDEEVEELARLVVKAGADINQQGEDEFKVTPLLNAVETRPTVVKLLLDLGAKPNVADKDGHSPLMALADSFLVPTPTRLASAQLLLSRGANINQRDNDGVTALLRAASLKRWDLVRFFISKGANVNAQDKSGVAALMYAATDGNAEMAKLLLQAGGTPELKNKKGETALSLAQSQEVIITQIGITAGINPKEAEKQMIEIMNGRREITELMKAWRVKVKLPTKALPTNTP